MRRTNTFKLQPTKKQERKLFESADNCSRLWEESYTSSVCPRCGSKNVEKFKCLSCGLEAHRDAAGCVNIRLAREGGAVNWAVASPLLLGINDASKMQMRMKSLEAGTSL